MKTLYTNGCSYTANFNLAANDRYPSIIADQFKWNLKDRSEPGSCNSRIIRTTIKDCIDIKDNSDIVALIQLSHLHRTEYPTNDNPLDDPFFSIKSNNADNAPDRARQYADLYWRLHSDKHILINLFTGLIGLVGFFRQYQIDYRIFLGPNECKLFNFDDPRLNTLKQDSNILNLENFYMLGLTSSPSNHPDEAGMQAIADYFINLLCESR